MELENEYLKVITTPKAGEMLSVYDKKKGAELIYQGNQGWSGRNPSLFPIVGSTWKNGEYEIDGKTYHMNNHGLIRNAVLQEKADGGSIVYTLDSCEETRKQYPFDFHFEMRYSLEDNKVRIDYAIENTGNVNMPFSFGLHPAFITSRNPDEKFEDFSISFAPAAMAEQIVFHPDLSPVQRTEVMLDEWNLSREDLNQYGTLVFDDIKANRAVLSYKGEQRVGVDFEGYPSVALWSHPTPSDFICIEPWFGHSDFEKVEVPFEKREGTRILKPHQTFTASYTIEAL